jgi:hypothetical protein
LDARSADDGDVGPGLVKQNGKRATDGARAHDVHAHAGSQTPDRY